MGEEEASRYILADGLAILRAPHVLDVVQHVLVVVVTALGNSQNETLQVPPGSDGKHHGNRMESLEEELSLQLW